MLLATPRIQDGFSGPAVAPKRHMWDARPNSAVRNHAPQPLELPAQMALSVVTTAAGLEALEDEWNALFAECGRDIHLFQSFNWIWHWHNHFLAHQSKAVTARTLYIVTGRYNGKLALICPFVRDRRAGFTTLRFAGDLISQYGDVLLDEKHGGRELLARAWSLITESSRADVIALRKVRADSNLAQLLDQSNAIITDRQIAPYLDLSSAPDYGSYEQRYSSKARKNRRRLVRRFEERGPATANILKGGVRAGEVAELSVSLKRAWLKQRGLISPALSKEEMRPFFAAVAADSERPVGAVVTYLTSCGETAAIEVAFDCKGRRAAFLVVYALKFEQAGAGQIVFEQSIRDAMKDKIGVFDLLAPGDAYKFDWADGSVEVLDWAQGLTPLGRTFAKCYLNYGRAKLKHAIIAAGRLKQRLMHGRPWGRQA